MKSEYSNFAKSVGLQRTYNQIDPQRAMCHRRFLNYKNEYRTGWRNACVSLRVPGEFGEDGNVMRGEGIS